MREVRFVDGVAIAVMDEAPPNFVRARQIMFKGGSSKKILINEHVCIVPCRVSTNFSKIFNSMQYSVLVAYIHYYIYSHCLFQHQIMAAFDGREHEFTLNNNRHRIRFGAPLRELYVGK